MKMISLEKPPLNELAHFGVRGMKWGIRKNRPTSPKLTYHDRAKVDYIKRGFSDADSEALAKRKTTIRKAALIAGGVTVAVGAAFVVRHLYVENKDMNLKAGKKAFHIARGAVTDLEPGRGLFVTVDQADRFAYRFRLNNPNGLDRIERTFEYAKDIKIPSPKKSAALYDEFTKDSNNQKAIKEVFDKLGTNTDYRSFVTYGPYFSKGESWHAFGSNNPNGENIWNGYKKFLMDKGYQGILDANDRAKENGFNVERPTILFDAAASLKEVSRKSLGATIDPRKTSIPTIREIGSATNAGLVATLAGFAGITISGNSKALNSYRMVNPNSKKTNKEILRTMQNDPQLVQEVYAKVSKMKGKSR